MPISAAATPHASAQGSPAAVAMADARPLRVITLAPHVTELIFAAGAGDHIVATVSSSDYPRKARSIARIGDGVRINAEVLVARHPDIVFAWQPTTDIQALHATLSASGIALQYSQPRQLDDIPREILRLGQLFGTDRVAAPAAAELMRRINTLRTRYAYRAPVRVFFDLGAESLYTLGNDPLLNNVLSICGGVNIYADASIPAPQVSPESVLSRHPDAILLTTSQDRQGKVMQSHWERVRLKAALDGHSYRMNPDQLFRPGPRLIDATEQLCEHLDKARQSKQH